MKRKLLAAVIVITSISHGAYAQSVPRPDHVVVLMLENYGYPTIIGNTNAPHINALINDPNTALFTQSFGLYHPSQPNYVMLYSGNNQGITNDNTATNTPFTTCNLGASLISGGFTFKGFSEDLVTPGDLTTSTANYVRRHCPWVNWLAASGTNSVDPALHQPYTSFPTNTNYSSLPTVSFVIPNLNDDMHNPTLPTANYQATAISNGDNWVNNNITDYINWAKANNSLLILTFDEDEGVNILGVSTSTNQITTMFIGAMVHGGSYSEHIDHYSVLRTLEDMYGLAYCGSSATATPITDCWTSATGIENNEKNENLIIFPNPASDGLTLDFNSVSEQSIKITLTDILSQTLLNINKEVKAGGNFIQLQAEKLAPGTYFVHVMSSGTEIVKKVVIK